MMKKDKPLKVSIRGPVRDILRFATHISDRHRIFRGSSSEPQEEKYILRLRQALHPETQYLTVDNISHENATTASYKLVPDTHRNRSNIIAPFQAGQYLSVEVAVNGKQTISRPYSISSTPEESRRNNAYVITVKNPPGAFIPEIISKTWKVGTSVKVSDPWGQFHHHPLRDPSHLLCIAGGSGITPFRSILGEVLSGGNTDISAVLIQGAANYEELVFSDFFMELERKHPGRFRWIPVLSVEKPGNGKINHDIRSGFIDADILSEAMAGSETSVFICGPEALHRFIDEEMGKAGLRPKRIRREDYGISGKPEGRETVDITVKTAGWTYRLTADKGETVLTALERAGLEPPSRCRTGTCGWCRGSLLEGKIRYDRVPGGLRSADREGGYFHPCAAKPETDLLIEIPGKPVQLQNDRSAHG